jgi:DNA polymerase-3 subunit delta'
MSARLAPESRADGSGAVAPAVPPVLARLVGQPRAVALLAASVASPVNAYLFIGPGGTGKRDAGLAFAASLVCPSLGCGRCVACTEALAGRHPDVVVVERSSQSIRVDEARAVIALAQRAPRAARRQVLVLSDFHLVDEAAPALLKTIEEPPSSTVFVILAERVPPPLVTIASRCVDVHFAPLAESDIASVLVGEGVDPARAAEVAGACGGRLDRARLLASDPGAAARQALWRGAPEQLDGTGSTTVLLASKLLAACDEVVEVVRARQGDELAALAEQARATGERGGGRSSALDERHRREQRRARLDELRAGLAWLAAGCRDRALADGIPPRRVRGLLDAAAAVDEAGAALVRNPNEVLLLQALLSRIDRCSA